MHLQCLVKIRDVFPSFESLHGGAGTLTCNTLLSRVPRSGGWAPAGPGLFVQFSFCPAIELPWPAGCSLLGVCLVPAGSPSHPIRVQTRKNERGPSVNTQSPRPSKGHAAVWFTAEHASHALRLSLVHAG